MFLGKCKTVLFERDQSFIVIQEAKVEDIVFFRTKSVKIFN